MSTPEFVAPDDAIGGDKKRLIVAGGVAAALVLGYGGYTMMSGGSQNQALVIPIRKHPAAVQPVNGAAPAVKQASAKVPAPSTVTLGRDPFLALYTVPAVVVAPVAPVGSVTPGFPAPGTGSSAGTGTVAPSNYVVKLARVYGSGSDQTAQFVVKGKTQLARVGAVFGATQEIKLLSLQENTKGEWTAVLQVGDAEPFDALAGKPYYVL